MKVEQNRLPVFSCHATSAPDLNGALFSLYNFHPTFLCLFFPSLLKLSFILKLVLNKYNENVNHHVATKHTLRQAQFLTAECKILTMAYLKLEQLAIRQFISSRHASGFLSFKQRRVYTQNQCLQRDEIKARRVKSHNANY